MIKYNIRPTPIQSLRRADIEVRSITHIVRISSSLKNYDDYVWKTILKLAIHSIKRNNSFLNQSAYVSYLFLIYAIKLGLIKVGRSRNKIVKLYVLPKNEQNALRTVSWVHFICFWRKLRFDNFVLRFIDL